MSMQKVNTKHGYKRSLNSSFLMQSSAKKAVSHVLHSNLGRGMAPLLLVERVEPKQDQGSEKTANARHHEAKASRTRPNLTDTKREQKRRKPFQYGQHLHYSDYLTFLEHPTWSTCLVYSCHFMSILVAWCFLSAVLCETDKRVWCRRSGTWPRSDGAGLQPHHWLSRKVREQLTACQHDVLKFFHLTKQIWQITSRIM